VHLDTSPGSALLCSGRPFWYVCPWSRKELCEAGSRGFAAPLTSHQTGATNSPKPGNLRRHEARTGQTSRGWPRLGERFRYSGNRPSVQNGLVRGCGRWRPSWREHCLFPRSC
jgi:hypothetical protein